MGGKEQEEEKGSVWLGPLGLALGRVSLWGLELRAGLAERGPSPTSGRRPAAGAHPPGAPRALPAARSPHAECGSPPTAALTSGGNAGSLRDHAHDAPPAAPRCPLLPGAGAWHQRRLALPARGMVLSLSTILFKLILLEKKRWGGGLSSRMSCFSRPAPTSGSEPGNNS